jgi:hypothetical protein
MSLTMTLDFWKFNHWLPARIAAGVLILAVLAIWDWRKRGLAATRWREYSLLLFTIAAAMIYGIVNDQITSRISWEYFYYGKELDEILGPQTPPDSWRLSLQAARIGMMATWSAGAVIGVAILIANNPRRTLPQLSYPILLRLLPMIAIITIAFAILGGVLGYFGLLTPLQQDFGDMVAEDLWRPRRFMCTWGIHLGGYVGGVIAILWSVYRIHLLRRYTVDHGKRHEHP